MKRYAIVRNARTQHEAEAYLPANYNVIWEGYEPSSSTCPRTPASPRNLYRAVP